MKKFAAIFMTLVMVLLLGLTASAAFVSSPSNNLAPVIQDFEPETDDCDAELKVTPYSDRYSLTEEEYKTLEEAYNRISGKKDDEKLSEALRELAEEKGVKVGDLSVSDLFNVGYDDCEAHEEDGHKGFKVTLKADTIDNFAGLLYFDGENWKNVKILSYDAKKGTVTFFTEDLGCFAFVVNKYIVPNTGDTSMAYVWFIFAAACAMAACCVVLPRKQRS